MRIIVSLAVVAALVGCGPSSIETGAVMRVQVDQNNRCRLILTPNFDTKPPAMTALIEGCTP